MSDLLHVLAFSGSLRKASFNAGLLDAAKESVPQGLSLEIVPLAPIPLYNADLDGPGAPEPVRMFKERIARADALLIATPEYNYSVPGVLKNAIDWASRPAKQSPLDGKPVAMMGAGGIGGTVRAQMHLRQILLFNGCLVLSKPEVYVMRAWEKFDVAGRLLDDPTREQIRALLEALLAWMRRLA